MDQAAENAEPVLLAGEAIEQPHHRGLDTTAIDDQ
jgi:hypothetical protein